MTVWNKKAEVNENQHGMVTTLVASISINKILRHKIIMLHLILAINIYPTK